MKSEYKAIKVNGRKYDQHRYIMEQYIGRKLNYNEIVHHKNGNKLDNRIENLEIVDRSEHARMHGIGRTISKETRKKISDSKKGKIGNGRKLTADQVKEIRNRLSAGESSRKIADDYGVQKTAILRIKNRITYADVA